MCNRRALGLLLLLTASLLSLSCKTDPGPRAVGGYLDLRQIDFSTETYLEAAGEWAFFWNADLKADPESYHPDLADEMMDVPAYWHPYTRGAAVYSLDLLLPEDVPEIMALKLTNVLENYRLYVDGKLICEVGKVSSNPRDARAESRPELIPFRIRGRHVNLQLHISNWADLRGGLNRKVYFGTCQSLRFLRERFLALDALLFGAVFVLGLFHMAIFILHRDRLRFSYLFLALVCFLIALYTGCKDELLLKTVFPGFSAELRSLINYSALTLAIPLFFCYLFFIFDRLFHPLIFRLVISIALVSWLIILFTPREVYTRLLIPLEIFSLVVTLYTCFMLIRNRFQGDRLSTAFLGGYFILLLGELAGILDNMAYVPAITPHLVFIIFFIYQALVQAAHTAAAYSRIEGLNEAYRAMEKENEKNYGLSYTDSLTGLFNRRRLNEYMDRLWKRNTLTAAPVSLMVIDIDYFKRYNDRYGHQQGDACLIAVAAALRQSVGRRDDFVARYGGEEFIAAVACTGDELLRLAQRILDAVRRQAFIHEASEVDSVVTVSIGLSSAVPSKELSWQELFCCADEALYEAKQRGRNRYAYRSCSLPGALSIATEER